MDCLSVWNAEAVIDLGCLIDLMLDLVSVAFRVPLANESQSRVDADPLVVRIESGIVGNGYAFICE